MLKEPVLPKSIRSWEMTWPEFRDRVGDSTGLLPVGSLEQHGLHLPLDTDTFIAQAIAERVAEQVNGIVLPPIAYGARSLARSGGGDAFAGTTNLKARTLISLVADVVEEQVRHGMRHLVVLLGHGENDPFVIEGVYEAIQAIPASDIHAIVIGWWHVLSTEDVMPLFPTGFPGWDLEHAGRVESALMLAISPERVRRDLMTAVDSVVPPPWTAIPHQSAAVPSQGALSDPRGVTPTDGRRLIELIVSRLVAIVSRQMQISSDGPL